MKDFPENDINLEETLPAVTPPFRYCTRFVRIFFAMAF